MVSCSNKKTDTSTREKVEQNTDVQTSENSASSSIYSTKKTVYAWVDRLNVRNKPGTKGKSIASVREADSLEYSGEHSDFEETIVLRGVAYTEPWLKVRIPNDKEGWVFGGAVKTENEEKGNKALSDVKLAFPYFGRFDLREWKKMPSRDESEGDAEIITTPYKKGGMLLEISNVEVGEYGYQRKYKLYDLDMKLVRLREFKYTTDIEFGELTEVVKNFRSSPPKQYKRIQNLKKHYSQLNARPFMVNGEWEESVLSVLTSENE